MKSSERKIRVVDLNMIAGFGAGAIGFNYSLLMCDSGSCMDL